MRRAAVFLAFALAACGTNPKVPPGDKPVAISCVRPDAPVKPKVHTPEELAKAPDGPSRYVMMAGDYLALFGWSLTADPIIQGCKAAGS